MKKYLLFLGSCALLIGCTTIHKPVHFVVLRDVPLHPTFAVYPWDDGHTEYYASLIEEALIGFGVRTLKRPTPKVMTTQKESGVTKEALSAESEFAGVMRKGSRNNWKTGVDYVISIDESTKRTKIIKIDTNEILASFVIPYKGPTKDEKEFNFKMTLHDALSSVGIQVRPHYMSYQMAQAYFRKEGIRFHSMEEWKTYCHSSKKPKFIPSNPDEVYRDSGWKSWDEWFEYEEPLVRLRFGDSPLFPKP
jgi:hypothetical protein